MNNLKDRNSVIDIAKGIGIILVILGHCLMNGSFVFSLIFSFHMPLFFFLSGYCYKKCSNNEIVVKKFKSLIIPFILYSLFGLIITVIVPDWRMALSIKGIIFDIYLCWPNNLNNSSIWFLVCLFFVVIFFNLVVTKFRVKKLFMFSVISYGIGYFIILLVIIFGEYLPLGRLPFNLDCVFIALSFFSLGVWMKNNRSIYEIVIKDIKIGIIFFTILQIVFVKLNGNMNLHGLQINNPILYFISAINGIVIVLILSSLFDKNIILNRMFVYLGQRTLIILGTQSIIIRLIIYCINHITDKSLVLYQTDLPYSFIIFVLTLFIEVLVIFIYDNLHKLLKK